MAIALGLVATSGTLSQFWPSSVFSLISSVATAGAAIYAARASVAAAKIAVGNRHAINEVHRDAARASVAAAKFAVGNRHAINEVHRETNGKNTTLSEENARLRKKLAAIEASKK
jgi:hypothetical protein